MENSKVLVGSELREYILKRRSVTFGGLLRRGLLSKKRYELFKYYATADYAFCISDKEFDDMTINDLFKYWNEDEMIKYWEGIGPQIIKSIKSLTGEF